MMKPISEHKIQNIFIRSANWVGDTVMSMPMIRSTRLHFPDARITVLAKPWVAPVFDNNPYIDHVMIYETSGRHKGLLGLLRLGKDLRKHRFDLAILLQNAFEAAFLAYIAGIPARLGYNTDGRTFLLTHPVQIKPFHKKRHQTDYYLGILQGADIDTWDRELCMFVSPRSVRKAHATLYDLKISGANKPIGINPGAAFGTAKRWSATRFAQVSRMLKKNYDAPILVFGGPNEADLGRKICDMAGSGCTNLCGNTTLSEAIALIRECRIFITNDSGLMHVAAGLKIPQIAIFGPTDHIQTSPLDSNSHMVRGNAECSPCFKQECPKDHRCMNSVSVEMVYDAAISVLEKSCRRHSVLAA